MILDELWVVEMKGTGERWLSTTSCAFSNPEERSDA